MLTEHASLRDWVRRLRPDAVDHDEVIVFSAIPLFVIFARYIAEKKMFEAYTEAIADGVGDPDDLRPFDVEQTSRLESAILSRSHGLTSIRELVSIDWRDFETGPRSISICAAYTPEDGLLALYDCSCVPSFQVVAAGPYRELQTVAADVPEILFPRLSAPGATLRAVTVHFPVCWTRDDLGRIVDAMVGVVPRDAHLFRQDLLTQVDDDDE